MARVSDCVAPSLSAVLRSVLSPAECALLLAKGPWQESRWPLLEPRLQVVLTSLGHARGGADSTKLAWRHKRPHQPGWSANSRAGSC
jgi:hypothetical protein